MQENHGSNYTCVKILHKLINKIQKLFYYFKCNQFSDREKHLFLSPAKSILMPQADAVPRIHKY